MSFSQDNGYIPTSFADIMTSIRTNVNTQFSTTYTDESFVGSNWYKYSYSLAQKIHEGEIKTSEIFIKLQEYIAETNLKIQRPSVSLPGILDSFAAAGYIASVKKMVEADAGKASVCVDVDPEDDDFAATKLEIGQLLSQFYCGGVVTLGSQTQAIVLSNGQSFDFKFSPPDKTPIKLKLTLLISENTLLTIPTDIQIRDQLFAQINTRYKLGLDFEPQRYFTPDDAHWAAEVLLEYSINDGVDYVSDVFEAAFDDQYTFGIEDIAVEFS